MQRALFHSILNKIWPELEAMSLQKRLVGFGDVLIFFMTLPLAFAGMVWLFSTSQVSRVSQNWLIFLLLLVLFLLFNRLNYFIILEIRPERYGSADGSLSSMLQWTGVFLFGPTALWISVLWTAFNLLKNWQRFRSTAARWSALRNFSTDLSINTLGYLIPLIFYQRWEGGYPLPGLRLDGILLAMAALGVHFLVVILIWSGYTAYVIWVQRILVGPASLAPILKFILLALGLPFLALPFSILLAGLYEQNGLPVFLFMLVGLLLVALLARQLSWAVEISRQKSRQLEKLEQLGRDILNSPPDASLLPNILGAHVPMMFPSGRVAIWLADGGYYHKHPQDWSVEIDPVWHWLRQQRNACAFQAGEKLPWRFSHEDHDPIVVSPLMDTETGEVIGCVYMELRSLAQPWDQRALVSLFPAVDTLAAQVASALHQAQKYQETLALQVAMQELEFAGRIQASFLPNEMPSLDGWELAVTLWPARDTSGDYFDIIPLQDGKMGILIADVADKGLGAALYMALSRTLIRTYALEFQAQPDIVFFSANERILQDARANLFVTAFYGILDQATGTLTYCNAGHHPPFLLSYRENGSVQALTATGMPIGVDEDAFWRLESVNIAPGDVLILYTDGIPDAQNNLNQFFTERRLVEVAQENLNNSAQEIQKGILTTLQAFVGDAPQYDDITLLVVRRDVT